MTPRENLTRIHAQMMYQQAPPDRCVVCLKIVKFPVEDYTQGLICSPRCDKILARIMTLCSRLGYNISHMFDAVAESAHRSLEKTYH